MFAIMFLLDKNQDGLVEEKDWGKAIGLHVGTFEETTTTTTADRTESQSSLCGEERLFGGRMNIFSHRKSQTRM